MYIKEMSLRSVSYFLWVVLFLVYFAGCAVTTCPKIEKDGKIYGWEKGVFREDWDDYYACAVSYIEGGLYHEAIWALEKAIYKRDRDQRRARTYGMHVVDDYFPHREKGIVHFHLGEYHKAKDELELSILQQESDKAFHFLDKVRRTIMRLEKQPVSKPAISVTIPNAIKINGQFRSNSDPVVLSGTIEDRQYVSQISLSEQPLFLKCSQQKIDLYEELSLNQGRREINVMAESLSGGVSKKRIILHIDRSGPTVIVTQRDTGSRLIGYLLDESGVSDFYVNGKPVHIRFGTEVPFDIETGGSIDFMVSDMLGNQTKGDLAQSKFSYGANKYLAGRDHISSDALSRFESKEVSIELDGWPDSETVFVENIHLQGKAISGHPIDALTLNGRNILNKPGPVIFFNQSVNLIPGVNEIIISATDRSGRTQRKNIRIDRKIQTIHHPRFRYRLAIHPFENTGERFFNASLAKYFVALDRFRIRRISDQQHPVYKNKPADGLLLGNMNQTGSSVEVIARFIDGKTSEIIHVMDAYSETNDRSDIEKMAKRLSDKALLAFHRIGGKVTGLKVKWKFWESCPDFIVEFNENNELASKTPFILYRENPVYYNPVTGESLGSDTMIISCGCGKGECPEYFSNETPKIGDKVITQ